MKLLLVLMLLPFACFVSNVPAPVATSQDYKFELTVNATSEDAAVFTLLVTGVTLTENGEQKPYRKQYDSLKAPYKLHLEDGEYTAVIEAKKGSVLSKVQGIRNGERMGSAMDDSKKTILKFGFGGHYQAEGSK